jgi:primary-amine oxidase
MTAVEDPTVTTPGAVAGHPLEPLSSAEIATATEVLRASRGLTEAARFVFVSLREPPKAAVFDWSPGDEPLPREAHIVLYQRSPTRRSCRSRPSRACRRR